MAATGAPGELALAPHDETSPPALMKRFVGGEV
jgi:hypothetical protein